MIEIDHIDKFTTLLSTEGEFDNLAFQGINFLPYTKELKERTINNCLFIGCVLEKSLIEELTTHNFIFPKLNVPFPTHPSKLYKASDLYVGYDWKKPESYKGTLDFRVYRHFMEAEKAGLSIKETLARRLHDHGITNALHNLIDQYKETDIVAIMGGHAMQRDSSDYKQIAKIAAAVHRKGKLMVSGGGPGAMEATHFGVWMSQLSSSKWEEALDILSAAPSYKDKGWLSAAFEVMHRFPSGSKEISLGIPTWLYGHEPPAPFASHIAKYFANSIREDGLLAIAKGGVVYSPGSAGTIQEIFQDATQNHYLTEEIASPMIFFGKDYWTKNRPIYPLLEKLQAEGKYKHLLLSITDDVEEVAEVLMNFGKE